MGTKPIQKDFPDSMGLASDSFMQCGISKVGPKNKKSKPCHTAESRLTRALRSEQKKNL